MRAAVTRPSPSTAKAPTPPSGGVFVARSPGHDRRRRAPGHHPHRPRDRRAQPGRRRRGAASACRRGGVWLADAAGRGDRRHRAGDAVPSARSTSPSTATTSACARSLPGAVTDIPVDARRAPPWCWSTTCSSPAAPCGPPSTPSPTTAGPGRCSWPCSSTAATASCRSGPTSSARTCRPAATRTVEVTPDGVGDRRAVRASSDRSR